MNTEPGQAVFISSLGANRLGGAGICSLAYLEAVAAIFPGRTHYVGPPLEDEIAECLNLASVSSVPSRGFVRKVIGLLTLHSVDRLSPVADRWLGHRREAKPVLFVNGERAGRFCRMARDLGMKSVFLPHNYAPRYLDAECRSGGIRNILYRAAYLRNALAGCRDADLCVFLTAADRKAYEARLGMSLSSLDRGYFAPSGVGIPRQADIPRLAQVCLNTNLALTQNQQGVLDFVHQIWPGVLARVPCARLVIAGVAPPRSLADRLSECPGVRLVARPDDGTMERIFAESRVTAATTQGGSGIKIRVGEALRRGLAVVSTPECAVGYEAISDHYLRVYSSPSMAIHALVELLDDETGPDPEAVRAEYRITSVSQQVPTAWLQPCTTNWAFEALLNRCQPRKGQGSQGVGCETQGSIAYQSHCNVDTLPNQWIVVQKGAREHYLVARALEAEGMLSGLLVDWQPGALSPLLRAANRAGLAGARRALDATAEGIPAHKVRAMNGTALRSKIDAAVRRTHTGYERYLRSDRRFARNAARVTLPQHDAVFAYSYAALEFLQASRDRGKKTILGQIDPGIEERRIVIEEERRWPEYLQTPTTICDAYEDRNREEWRIADRIVVNSTWSARCLEKAGADPARIRICPLAYEPRKADGIDATERTDGVCRILWLGTLSIRKGIQYLVEAVKLVKSQAIEVIVAGPSEIDERSIRRFAPPIRYVGAVPRSQVAGFYQSADVFVLPTLSDGFAITQLEAMAYGLPVIATERCGDVVAHGVEGLRVPGADPESLAAAIDRLASNPGERRAMGAAAREKCRRFSIASYASALKAAWASGGEDA